MNDEIKKLIEQKAVEHKKTVGGLPCAIAAYTAGATEFYTIGYNDHQKLEIERQHEIAKRYYNKAVDDCINAMETYRDQYHGFFVGTDIINILHQLKNHSEDSLDMVNKSKEKRDNNDN